jgi:quinol monooxygenase YgiN
MSLNIFFNEWEFDVKKGCIEEFVKLNGYEGTWHQFFLESEQLLGYALRKPTNHNKTFGTVEMWKSEEGFKTYIAREKERYDALCAANAQLYDNSRRVVVSKKFARQFVNWTRIQEINPIQHVNKESYK